MFNLAQRQKCSAVVQQRDQTYLTPGVCPVCLGYPGTLPVVNREAVIMAIALGKALNGRINQISRFHRKNYFYPDLPKGYQITQGDVPIIEDACLQLSTGKKIPIKRIHLEEDAAKSVHVSSTGRLSGAEETLLDFNRSGIPLIEIVTDPVFESPEEAAPFGGRTASHLEVSGHKQRPRWSWVNYGAT